MKPTKEDIEYLGREKEKKILTIGFHSMLFKVPKSYVNQLIKETREVILADIEPIKEELKQILGKRLKYQQYQRKILNEIIDKAFKKIQDLRK